MHFLSILASFLVTALLVRWLSHPESPLQVLDVPNARSLHTEPVSRTGGIGILLGVGAGLLALVLLEDMPGSWAWMFLGLALVSAVSVMDDRSHLPAGIRLGAHFAAAGSCLIGGAYISALEYPGGSLALPAALGVAFSALFLVWMTNLYNFMDGMDGFAGGMTVFGFGGLGLLGFAAGDPVFAALAWIISASAAGFLLFNFPSARIFMGDVGSAGLGFLAAALALWGARQDLFPLWAAVLLFGPFVVDATVTLVRRLWRGEHVWKAHRTHYYQRLVQLGWGHRRTVLCEYGLMLLSLIGTLLAVGSSVVGQWKILVVLAAVYLAAMLWVDSNAPMISDRDQSAKVRK